MECDAGRKPIQVRLGIGGVLRPVVDILRTMNGEDSHVAGFLVRSASVGSSHSAFTSARTTKRLKFWPRSCGQRKYELQRRKIKATFIPTLDGKALGSRSGISGCTTGMAKRRFNCYATALSSADFKPKGGPKVAVKQQLPETGPNCNTAANFVILNGKK